MRLQDQQAMACEKVTELLPEYILGQTSAEQDAELRAHFSTCAACAQALAEFVAVSARIAQAVPQVAPPTQLKAALMARVAASGAPVTRQDVQPKRSLSRLFTFARLGLAVIIGLLAMQSVRLWREAQTVAQEADRQRAAVVDISQNPRSVALNATADGGKSSGWMKFSPDAQTGVLTVANMPALPASQAYQLWLVLPDGTRDDGGVLYTPATDGEQRLFVINAPRPFGAYNRCGFSREPVTGSPAPTGPGILRSDATDWAAYKS